MASPVNSVPWILVVAAGLGLGAFAWWGDDGVDVETPWRVLALLANMAAPWVVVALLLGRKAGSPSRGALAGGLASVVGVATYYVLHLLTGSGAPVGTRGMLVWVGVGAVVGPLMGLCGGLTVERGERPPVLAAALPAGALLAEAMWLGHSAQVWKIAQTWHIIDLVVVVTLVVAVVWLCWRLVGDPRRFPATMALVIALALGGAVVFSAIRSTVVG